MNERRQWRRWVVAGAVVLALTVITLALRLQANARLVAGNPDSEGADASLMHAALGPGHAQFNQHCAGCHGASGKGPLLGVPDLTDSDWVYGQGQVSDIEQVITHGIRAPDPKTWRLADMPAFALPTPYAREPAIKPLAPQDVDDLVAFLDSLGGRPADPVRVARGAGLFRDRGGCYDCHGSDGRGDSAIGGPNLADSVWLYGGDRASIFRSIAQGRAGYCPSWSKKLSPAAIRQIALYVYSLSHGGRAGHNNP
jgi:cytochrome c oxidase cbb3-type subunit 3